MGRVIYPSIANSDGCQPLKWDQFQAVTSTSSAKGDKKAQRMPYFVLVDRGNCSNPQKVRNVENFGGAVALIADYVSEDVEALVMNDYGGSGHSLITPGFMIDQTSGATIKKACTTEDQVVMRASFTIAKADNEIVIGLLYSSSLDLDSASMESFETIALESAKDRQKALLDLHIHTFGCPTCPEQI